MRLGIATTLVLVVLLGLTATLAPPPAQAARGIEGYASYDPSKRCHEKPFAGTRYLSRWVVRAYGGDRGGTARSCRRHPTSEHQTGRAFDWTLDARTRVGRERARAFLQRIRATDRHGHADAWARRMGVMYVIWNDRMYPAWTRFDAEPYLSSSCPSRRRCSATLRHRDHVHVSLSRRGARGLTSWYAGRL